MNKETKDIVSIDFYDTKLAAIEKDGETYIAMKPIVEGIGLDWKSQHKKLVENKKKFGCGDITTPSKGGPQISLCIPLKKLNGYLFSINPEKVHKDIWVQSQLTRAY